MKNKHIKFSKNNGGITLIALIVTIIVLIILAGVSITLLLGKNGLIEKAKYAKEQQTIETIREKLEIVKTSDYIEKIGNNSIDTYFEVLEKEKVEPYVITKKEKITEIVGSIEVDNKYSYIAIIENNGLTIKYEGIIGEFEREPDEVLITVISQEEKENLPLTLTVNVKSNGKDVTSGKYEVNGSEEKLGLEDDLYTKQIVDTNINITLETENTYYIHTLTLDRFGRKQETVKGPITVKPKYHMHIGLSSTEGGCYTIPVLHAHSSSCYTQVKTTCNWKGSDDHSGEYDRCPRCGSGVWKNYQESSPHYKFYCKGTNDYYTSKLTCTKANKIESYRTGCGKIENDTIEGYTIKY